MGEGKGGREGRIAGVGRAGCRGVYIQQGAVYDCSSLLCFCAVPRRSLPLLFCRLLNTKELCVEDRGERKRYWSSTITKDE